MAGTTKCNTFVFFFVIVKNEFFENKFRLRFGNKRESLFSTLEVVDD